MSYIKGMNSLLSKLNSLPGRIQEGGLDEVQKSVDSIKQDAKLLAPKDTGELANKIVSNASIESSTRIKGTVTSKAEHSSYVEFGTGSNGASLSNAGALGLAINYDNDIAGRAPTPFMYPSYILHRDESKERIINRIRSNIREVTIR